MEDVILKYIRDEYLDDDDDEEVELDSSTPIVDSFSMVSLKRFLEKKYSISIPDEEASTEAFDTVASIVQLVQRHQGGG